MFSYSRYARFVVILLLLPLFSSAFPQIRINEFMAANINACFDKSYNYVDWVELYNESSNTVNLNGYSLTDDPADPKKYQIWGDILIQPGNYLVISLDKDNRVKVSAKEVHTNFSLSVDGDFIGLYKYSGQVADTVSFGQQARNISCGRLVSDPSSWGYFVEPTPEERNDGAYLTHSQTAGDIQFSVTPGFYSGSVTVELTTIGDVDQVRYTLNGDYPNSSSTIYSGAITISESKVIRAGCFAADRHPGQVSSGTYFLDIPTPNLPVISLSTDIENFEDDWIGIYCDGTNGISNIYFSPDKPVNWLRDWERPINFEFFTREGEHKINQLVGTKVFGGYTQSFPIKSLAIISRKDYGKKGLDHKFFEDKEVDEFKSLVLRNSGNDAVSTYLRDGYMQTIVKDRMDMDNQAYQPALVYLNGEYFGLLNIREKMNEHYAASNYGVDPDNIDVINLSQWATHGNSTAYYEMINYVRNNNLANQASFDHVASMVDVDEFLNYFLTNIYYANEDWPIHNNKLWRERKEGAKWRALMFDTDQGFAFNEGDRNTLLWAMQDDISTEVFRGLLQNETCKNEFFQRFAAHMNTTFRPERILPILDSLKSVIAPHIPYNIAQWQRPLSALNWDEGVNQKMPEFANTQIEEVQGWIKSYLGISQMYKLNVDINTGEKGTVNVCEVEVPSDYSGDHFAGLPIRLEAIPKPGFEFSGWTGDIFSSEEEIWIDMNSEISVSASFSPKGPIKGIYINEFLSSNTSGVVDDCDEYEDWIEIYNSNDYPVNLAGLYISDSAGFLTQHQMPFGDLQNTSIPAKGYTILWADKDSEQGSLHLPFKLRKSGEMIILSQQIGEDIRIIDSISYTRQYSDLTFGRDPVDSNLWKFLEPTPGALNQEKILENIFINEFMASNQSVLEDRSGEFDDWIELYNDNDYPVDIGGLFLSDDSDNKTKFRISTACPDSTTIAAKDYLLLWADDSTEQGILHLNFKLSGAGEQIVLSQANGVEIMDSVSYPNLMADVPYGRIPDGSGPFSYMLATQGESNTQPLFSGLFINEFMASNQSVLEDRPDEFDDWIEVYNDNDYSVNIGGLFLSDDSDNKTKFRISTACPDSTNIPTKGHILIWADDSVEQGILHAAFKLSGKGEQIILSSSTASEILDSISYKSMVSNAAFGRIEDGNPQFVYMRSTPGQSNVNSCIENVFINEIMASNSQSNTDEFGDYDDWIELYNANDFPVDIGGMFITDDYRVDGGYYIPTTAPELTTVDAKDYILIWADDSVEQGVLHANFRLSREGEKIVLLQPDGLTVADSLSFGSQYRDITVGRKTEESLDISYLIPTPGEANKTYDYEGIIISEVMAADHSGIMDEDGQYEDWIELYNSGAQAIDIALMMLTDSLGRHDCHTIPGGSPDLTTILPGEYLILWADNQPEQGVLHLGFGLREGGEQVGLSTVDGKLLDSLSYPNQFNNFSYSMIENNLWLHLPPTPGAENIVPAIESIYINEYMSDNENRLEDEFGEYDDWIELYNDNSYPVNIAGLYITDSLAHPNKYRISSNDLDNTQIPPKGYLLIWADNDDDQGALHTNFKLSRKGEELVLSGYDYHISIDSKVYDEQYSNFASARLNDQGPWIDMPPTPGTTNTLPDNSQIFINEIMTSNVNIISDNYGEYDDWIEFYNGGNEAIDLGGLFVSDSIGDSEPFRISSDHPDSTTIQPNKYLLIWADDSKEQGILHTNFKLSRSGEQVLLFNYDRKTLLDSITYLEVPKNLSFGRSTDGKFPWKEMVVPTPLRKNFVKATNPTPSVISSLSYEIYPNPASENLIIVMYIDVSTKVTVRVFDQVGNLVAIPLENYYQAGKYEFSWDLTGLGGSKLNSGIYTYVVETEGEFVSDKLVIFNID